MVEMERLSLGEDEGEDPEDEEEDDEEETPQREEDDDRYRSPIAVPSCPVKCNPGSMSMWSSLDMWMPGSPL